MEIFKRYVMLCVGLLIVAFGVAFSILADLGTSPISCPPYVASMLCPLTVGGGNDRDALHIHSDSDGALA